MSDIGSPGQEQQQPEVYFGSPTMEELRQYYHRLQSNPAIPNRIPSSEGSDDSSFELDESFQAMIERKRKKMIEDRLAAVGLDSTTEDEDSLVTGRSTDVGGGDSRFRCNDSTIIEQDSIHKTTDESFEAMERLCGSINLGAGGDAEESQLDAEMPPPSLDYTVQMKRATSKGEPTCLAEITQLEDIEEPSGMWENSILHATAANKMLSPIKRVHMLRPSTILEEATINETTTTGTANQTSSKNTSLESYATAKQQLDGSGTDNYSIITGSEVYRTAEEGSTINSTADSSAGVGFETTVVNKTSIENPRESVSVDEDVVIVLDSSSSEAEDSLPDGDKRLDDSSRLETSASLQENSLCLNDTSELENRPDSPLLDEIPDHFNDTMEEMEFMMRQGMKVMQQQKQAQEQEKSKKPSLPGPSILKKTEMTPVTPASPGRYLKPKQPTSASSAKQMLFPHSASKVNSAHKQPPPFGSSSCGTFKKPLVSRFPLPKSAKKFDHIKSPIGTYINKTPHTTLQAKIFCPNQNLVDVLHTNPHNRESVLSVKENNFAPQEPEGYASSLPRKGVVCSRGAHVLDERKTVRIPGGEKVHKLINSSPTLVIRHEGRLRYQRETPLTDDSVADDSVADLSMASGDVSVRILKDVRRF